MGGKKKICPLWDLNPWSDRRAPAHSSSFLLPCCLLPHLPYAICLDQVPHEDESCTTWENGPRFDRRRFGS